MPTATRGGRRLHWVEAGQGPRMVMLHAGLARASAWEPVIARLGGRFSVRAPDLPAHGETEHDPAAEIQRETMEDAALLADGPAHFVGHSFGAAAALHLAVRQPGLVRSLTLFEPVYFVLAHDAGDPAFARHLEASAPVRAALARGDTARALDLFLRRWNGEGTAGMAPDRRARAERRLHLVWAEGAIMSPDSPDRLHLDALRAVRVPVTLVRGADSQPVIAAVLRAIRGAVPQAREIVVAGAGHMLPLTHPDASAEAILGTAARA